MRLSKDQWKELIKEQELSGLSVTKYCELKSVSKTTFLSARSRLNNKSLKDTSFTRARIGMESSNQSSNLKLHLSRGIFIEFPVTELSQVVLTLTRVSL